jgi:subtilisin family serine protease
MRDDHRRWRRVLVALALLGGLAAVGPPGPAVARVQPAEADDVRDYIVVLRDRHDVPEVARRHAADYQARVARTYSRALAGYSARIPDRLVARLRADPRVAFVAPDLPVALQGTVALNGDTAPAGVRRIEAVTGAGARQASNANVAVFDTGIDLRHPDLDARAGKNCMAEGVPPDDDHGHGTHVAGTIAAANNGLGVVGVAPGTAVYAVKVLNSAGSGSVSHLLCGIDWLAANGGRLNIRIANLSLAVSPAYNDDNCGRSNSDPLHTAICNATAAGITFVAAAGNQGGDVASVAPDNYPEVLAAVGMVDTDGRPGGTGGVSCSGRQDDTAMSSSNYAVAQRELDHLLAAPADCVTSTAPGGGLSVKVGTSMASAHVTGSVALCIGDGAPGPCAGKPPREVIRQMRSDAAARSASAPGYGFAGDSASPRNGRNYGYLVWNGGAAVTTTTTSTSTTSTSTTTRLVATTTTLTATATTTAPPATSTTVPPTTVPATTTTTAPTATGRMSGQCQQLLELRSQFVGVSDFAVARIDDERARVGC